MDKVVENTTETEVEQARRVLDQIAAFQWLTRENTPSLLGVSEVQDALSAQGMLIHRDTILRWFNALPHTMRNSKRMGFRATRDDLIIHFAKRFRARD